MIGWSDLKQYIGVNDDSEDQRVQMIFNSATALVDSALSGAFRAVPEDVKSLMYLEVGSTLWDRRNSPNTSSQYAIFEGGALPVKGPRDPLATVRPVIARYVVPF